MNGTNELIVAIVRARDRVLRAADETIRGVGLSEPQFNVLRILRGAGEALPTSELGRRMITRVPDITRLVDRLVDAGLVARKRCTEDRRVVFVTLTRKGRKLVDDLDQPALDEARALAPGEDVYALEAQWRAWWADSGRKRLSNPGRAFHGWLKARR